MVYDDSGKPSKLLTLDSVSPLNTGCNKSEDGQQGAGGAITIHVPSFPPGICFTYPLDGVCDTVFNSSTNDMQNLAPPSTDPLHIPPCGEAERNSVIAEYRRPSLTLFFFEVSGDLDIDSPIRLPGGAGGGGGPSYPNTVGMGGGGVPNSL